MGLPKTIIASNPAQGQANLSGGNQAPFSDQLLEKARVNIDTALKELESRLSGLSAAEVEARIKRDGLNEIGREKRPSPLMRLWDNVKNPHWEPHLLRFTGRQYRRAAPADQLRQAHQSVHLADDPLHRRHGAGRLPPQRTEQTRLGASVPVCAGGGRRLNAGDSGGACP